MSYGTTAGLATYLTLTGRTLGTAATDAVSIFRANQYIDGTYWDRFLGTPFSDDVYFPVDGGSVIPQGVEYATYEAAILYAIDVTALTVSTSGSLVKSEKVDVISVEFFEDTTSASAIEASVPKFSVIEGLLRPYITIANSTIAAIAIN